MVTVEADVDRVERRLAAGELWCPSCGGVLAGWGRARSRQVRGADGPVRAVSAPVAVYWLRGDARVVAGDARCCAVPTRRR